MIMCAGCNRPLVTTHCATVNASCRTLPLSCSDGVPPLNLACGAWESVRCAYSLKSRASSKKLTVCVCVWQLELESVWRHTGLNMPKYGRHTNGVGAVAVAKGHRHPNPLARIARLVLGVYGNSHQTEMLSMQI